MALLLIINVCLFIFIDLILNYIFPAILPNISTSELLLITLKWSLFLGYAINFILLMKFRLSVWNTSYLGMKKFCLPFKTYAYMPTLDSPKEELIAFSSLFLKYIFQVSVLSNLTVFISAFVKLKTLGGEVCVLGMNTKSRRGALNGVDTHKWMPWTMTSEENHYL